MLAVDRGRQFHRNVAIGLYTAAIAVVAILVAIAGREFYRQGPIVVVAILLVTAVACHRRYASLSWDRNLVLVALRDHPHAITSATVEPAEGLAALLDQREVVIEASGHSVVLTFKRADLALLGSVLIEYCPNVVLHGFPS